MADDQKAVGKHSVTASIDRIKKKVAERRADPNYVADEKNQPTQFSLFEFTSAVDDEKWRAKGEIYMMEFPFVTLSKKKDTRIKEKRIGNRVLKIIPSMMGCPNVFDKDILYYVITEINRALDAGKSVSPKVRFKVAPYLKLTKKGTSSRRYEQFVQGCQRILGTQFFTNVQTNSYEKAEGFSLIQGFSIVKATKDGKGALEAEVVVSDWLYREILNHKIVTISSDYFKITTALKRRLYEIARKHCGAKEEWMIDVELLQAKTGSEQSARSFRFDLKQAIEENDLPDYEMRYANESKDKVIFSNKNPNKDFAIKSAIKKLSRQLDATKNTPKK